MWEFLNNIRKKIWLTDAEHFQNGYEFARNVIQTAGYSALSKQYLSTYAAYDLTAFDVGIYAYIRHYEDNHIAKG